MTRTIENNVATETPPRLRRGLRFNLSLLFVVISLLAVPLGWRAMKMREAAREREAIGQTPYIVIDEEKHAHAALQARGDFKFIDTPLDKAMKVLEKRFAVKIEIDTKCLDDAGLGPEIPITRDLKQVTLQDFLRQCTRNLELAYFVHRVNNSDAVILITTPERAAELTFTKIYNVGDLTDGQQNAAQLAEAVCAALGEPFGEGAAGGNGITRRTIGGFRDVLVVRGNAREHDEVAAVLRDIKLGIVARPMENR